MGRHRPTDGPKGAGTSPASKPSGSEQEICTEEAWHWRRWQRGQDGDNQTPSKSPWEEPGRDD